MPIAEAGLYVKQERQHVRERLAGPGLRDADHVAAGEHRRDRLRLDRGRVQVPKKALTNI